MRGREPAGEGILPVASPRSARTYLRRLLLLERRGFAVVITLQVVATVAGLVGPWALGVIVNDLTQPTT